MFNFKPGLISNKRSPKTTALFFPIVESNAVSCRFLFVGSNTSPSIIVISPTPARAINSAAKEPMPPNPTIKTCAFLSFANLSGLINNSDLSNQLLIF